MVSIVAWKKCCKIHAPCNEWGTLSEERPLYRLTQITGFLLGLNPHNVKTTGDESKTFYSSYTKYSIEVMKYVVKYHALNAIEPLPSTVIQKMKSWNGTGLVWSRMWQITLMVWRVWRLKGVLWREETVKIWMAFPPLFMLSYKRTSATNFSRFFLYLLRKTPLQEYSP